MKCGIFLIFPYILFATKSCVDTALPNEINAFQTKCLKIILNINREDHATKKHVHKLINTEPLMNIVTKTQVSFLDHSIRIINDFIQQYFLYVAPHGDISRGRQNTTYKQYIAIMPWQKKVLRDAASKHVVWLCRKSRLPLLCHWMRWS